MASHWQGLLRRLRQGTKLKQTISSNTGFLSMFIVEQVQKVNHSHKAQYMTFPWDPSSPLGCQDRRMIIKCK